MAGSFSSKQKQVDIDTRQVNVPAVPLSSSDAQYSQDIHFNTYLTFEFSTQNGALFANNVSIFPPSIPMQLNTVQHWHSGHQNIPLAYDLHALSIPSGPDELVGYMFLLKLKFSDLHGRPASDSMITITLNQRSDGNFTIYEAETDAISITASHPPY
ncbi:hypothetical protein NUH16_003278 [Penicillium rubens]|nr:hypothetical protein NUH16_003278 [Penicillium rubens]